MHSTTPGQPFLRISIPRQRLTLMAGEVAIAEFPVSTAANGPGEQKDSGCTPRGWHRVRARIGAGAPIDTVFRGRRPTGEIYEPALAARYPDRDWILTRILWLSGLEVGKNRLGSVDTMSRYIYIHGCPDSAPMGIPLSHGCIRMRNADIVYLFERVLPGTRVQIRAPDGADAP
uniref:L,D-transpeptidase catalytic domain n=1 Tax=Candidatus Kentrum sp. FM TaxID=2126340 RepID=A0A450RXA1_9GAMM|nr:MAG: L,D-transpeptidase catalytic domain [Candidatus Kentron sp. FM]VFJ43743.1 MAG: L,D-transpeptidase catalytic domain [Candidatus Kentron sp. FM]VFK08563.1 MAG: L,D-transpeptidase catalytic domain [Candidatus Kentron sp. FM]